MAHEHAVLQALTLPLDTAKVRLQLQGGGGGKYRSVRPRLRFLDTKCNICNSLSTACRTSSA